MSINSTNIQSTPTQAIERARQALQSISDNPNIFINWVERQNTNPLSQMIERLAPWKENPQYSEFIKKIIDLSKPIEEKIEEIFFEIKEQLKNNKDDLVSVNDSNFSFYENIQNLDEKTKKLVLRNFMNKMDLIETQDDKEQLLNEICQLQDEALKKTDPAFKWVIQYVEKEKKLPKLSDDDTPTGAKGFKAKMNGFERWFNFYSDAFTRYQQCNKDIEKTTLAAKNNSITLNEHHSEHLITLQGSIKSIVLNKTDIIKNNENSKGNIQERINSIFQEFNNIIPEHKNLSYVSKQENSEENKLSSVKKVKIGAVRKIGMK